MDRSSKRGKIPQADWPLIMARYDAGETLASIARTYDCSPPAISYVVSRSRTRPPEIAAAVKPPLTGEPQLIKAATEPGIALGSTHGLAKPPVASVADGPPNRATPAPHMGEPPPPATHIGATEPRLEQSPPPRIAHGREGTPERGPDPAAMTPPLPPHRPTPSPDGGPVAPNGAPNGASHGATNGAPNGATNGAPNGDQRRRLHLSLGNGNTGSHGDGRPADAQSAERSQYAGREQPVQHQTAEHQIGGERIAAPNGPGPAEVQPMAGRGDGSVHAPSDRHQTGNGQHRNGDAAPRKENAGTFIDHELRARVDTDIAAFLAAFDAALIEDTQQSRSGLREATDRLLRAGARTRIELERLEARLPLPPRDTGRPAGFSSESAWRHR